MKKTISIYLILFYILNFLLFIPASYAQDLTFSQIKSKYNLDDEMMSYIKIDTNYLTKNKKQVIKALDDNTYQIYCSYCHKKNYKVSAKNFKKRYEAVIKIEQAKNLTLEDKTKLYNGRNFVVKIDNKFYKNLYKVDNETITNAKEITTYGKYKFKNIKKAQLYDEIKEKNNLSEPQMYAVWQDTKGLKKNLKLVQEALNNKSYEEYYSAKTLKENPFEKKSLYAKASVENTNFKENYKTFIALKEDSEFSQKEINYILNRNGLPCASPNPTYWGSKEQKVRKTLNNKKLTKDEKYKKIEKRISYRKATLSDWANDISTRFLIITLLVSGVGTIAGIMAWASASDSSCLVQFVFK